MKTVVIKGISGSIHDSDDDSKIKLFQTKKELDIDIKDLDKTVYKRLDGSSVTIINYPLVEKFLGIQLEKESQLVKENQALKAKLKLSMKREAGIIQKYKSMKPGRRFKFFTRGLKDSLIDKLKEKMGD